MKLNQNDVFKSAALSEIADRVTGKSHRDTAVIGGAVLDAGLLQLIAENFLHCKANTIDDPFFGSNGPAGSFGNRIELAYRTGLIDGTLREVLRMVKGVRNLFAHSMKKTRLHQSAISDKITPIANAHLGDLNRPGNHEENFRNLIMLAALAMKIAHEDRVTLTEKGEVHNVCTNPVRAVWPAFEPD